MHMLSGILFPFFRATFSCFVLFLQCWALDTPDAELGLKVRGQALLWTAQAAECIAYVRTRIFIFVLCFSCSIKKTLIRYPNSPWLWFSLSKLVTFVFWIAVGRVGFNQIVCLEKLIFTWNSFLCSLSSMACSCHRLALRTFSMRPGIIVVCF